MASQFPRMILAVAFGCSGGCDPKGAVVTPDLAVVAPDLAVVPPDLAVVPPDLAGGPLTYAKWEPQFISAYCRYVFRCCRDPELKEFWSAFPSQADCEQQLEIGVLRSCGEEVGAGRVSFDAKAAQVCLTALNDPACSGGLAPFYDLCLLTNILGRRGAVPADWRVCPPAGCGNGFYISPGDLKCVAYPPKDGNCTLLCDPATKQFCDYVPDGGFAGRCANYFSEGADCALNQAGCDLSKHYCDSVTRKCSPLLASGAACDKVWNRLSCKSGFCSSATGKCIERSTYCRGR